MTKAGIMLASLLLVGAGTISHADGIYKWVDERGVTHFGERPPAKGNSQRINVSTIRPSGPEAAYTNATSANAYPATTQGAAPAAMGAPQPTQAGLLTPPSNDTRTPTPEQLQLKEQQDQFKKIQAENLKKNCKLIRANLTVLKESGRVKEVGADGQMQFLPDDQRDIRIKQSESYLKENCKD